MSISPSDIIKEFDSELVNKIDQHLVAGRYEDAVKELEANESVLRKNCSDTVAVIVKHLTDKNFQQNPGLFIACENLLKTVAERVKEEDALFELLEIVETTKSDNVFTSTLKALQICIRKQQDKKVRSLEWCLNSILTYVSELPFSERVINNTDQEAELLFEDDDHVRRVLTNYITLFLFYEPFLQDVIANKLSTTFLNTEFTRPNVLASFMLQLLNAPFFYLCLERPESKDNRHTNTYSWQCASTIVHHWTSLFPNPFILFEYVEHKKRWPKLSKAVLNESSSLNIFLNDEKTPIRSVAVLFYLIYAEHLMPSNAPQVYTPLYQLESVLYLATDMLTTNIHSLHYKTLQLCNSVLGRFGDQRIPMDSLDLPVHEEFCQQLIRVVTQTPSKRNSQLGGQIIRKYIFQFCDEGRMFLVTNLLKSVEHDGLLAYVAAMYKDMIAAALRETEQKQLSPHFSGTRFRQLLLTYICRLDAGVETDLLKHSDTIITALNVIRFLTLSDRSNRTGFWDVVQEVSDKFLVPLRRAMELTLAHYRLEERRVADGRDVDDVQVGVELANGEPMPPIDRAAKMKLLKSAMNTFDLIESLASRVDECVRAVPKT